LVKTSEMLNAAIPQTIAAMPRRFAPNDSTNADPIGKEKDTWRRKRADHRSRCRRAPRYPAALPVRKLPIIISC
jgi:hypothetical protein